MNYVQLLSENHPAVELARRGLRRWLLSHLSASMTLKLAHIDETEAARAMLSAHLAHVGDNHAVLVKKYQELCDECPELETLLRALGLGKWDVNYYQFFVAAPFQRGVMHIDGINRHCCINMALYNGDKGTIQWYESHGFIAAPPRVSHVGTLGTYPEKFEDRYTDLPPDEEVITEGLQLVKTDIWHRVDNTANDRYRTIFSIRLIDNPSFESTLKRLQPHLAKLK
mgnify:CR=1 FL=1